MINNLGGLSVLELHIVADEILRQLASQRLNIRRVFIGTFVTALDGPGVSVTLLKLDSELQSLLDAPTAVNAWPKSASGYSQADIEQQTVSAKGGPIVEYSAASERPGKCLHSSQRILRCRKSDSDNGKVSRELLQSAISSVAQAVQRDEPLITKYDTIAGDGDCGTTLLAGANGTKLFTYLRDRL